MGNWIKREDNWLHRPPRAKSTAEPTAESKKDQEKKEGEPQRYGVIYYPLRCPRCRSKDIKTHTSLPPIRYHKCKKCDYNFRSIEANDDPPRARIPELV